MNMTFVHYKSISMPYLAFLTHPSIFKTRMTVEAKCVPHYKSCNHLNSVKPSGNCLLICGNPTRPASLVTTKPSKPTLIISVTQLAEKITPVVMAADLFVTSLWEHPGMRHGGFRSLRLILMLQNTMRVNAKIIRSYIWDMGLALLYLDILFMVCFGIFRSQTSAAYHKGIMWCK